MVRTSYVVALMTFFSSCQNVENSHKTQVKTNQYPAYIVKSFMDGCLEYKPKPDASQVIICSCIMDKIQNKYTIEQFNTLSRLKEGQEWDEYQVFLNKVAEECIKESKK